MKSIKVLQKLAKNPYYQLTPEERMQLETPQTSGTGEEYPKVNLPSKGNAAVKSVGKLNKHETDPVAE